ncbi:MAG: HAMP domain-containing histidine kinase [Desulfobacterales bacterium]|nr:HAMP domain-containing histidine kinase [Desulfobacterales bacterium]
MKHFSLKWVLFTFYLIFGFLPLVAVSLTTLLGMGRIIESVTQEQMQISLTQIGLRMDMFYQEARDDLSGFARLIEVPCSFNGEDQDYKARLELMLLRFLAEHGQFEILAFCAPDSEVVAAADRRMLHRESPFAGGRFSAGEKQRILDRFMRVDTRFLPIIFDVHNISWGDPSKDGYLLGLIPISEMAQIFNTARFGRDVRKQIVDFTGQNLWQNPPLGPPGSGGDRDRGMDPKKIQLYQARVESLGWDLIARVDNKSIFGSLYQQLYANVGITLLVFLMAAAFAYELGRRVTRQLEHILAGTRAFAQGRLDHRVENIYGRELMALSTELNQMAVALEKRQSSIIQTNKLESLGLFTAGIAHEIKNPLASIKTSSQVLDSFFSDATRAGTPGENTLESVQFDGEDMSDIRTLSRGITEEVDRLNALLLDLLNFARPGCSKKQVVDVGAVVEKSLSFLHGDLAREKIQVEFQPVSFTAFIDPDQLTQILMNILLNAKNALKGKMGGRIFIHPSEGLGGERSGLVIADNGPGIPGELLDKIFDPFVSLSHRGSGLGLSIVYTLARQNGMEVRVSDRTGGGSCFMLEFPETESQKSN